MKFVAWGVISMGHSLKSHIKNCEDSRLRRMRIISKDEKNAKTKKEISWILFQSSYCLGNIWESPDNCLVFTVVMVMYHYVERIWIIIVTPNFSYKIYNREKYFPGEPVNIHIQILINIIQEKNWFITTKKG